MPALSCNSTCLRSSAIDIVFFLQGYCTRVVRCLLYVFYKAFFFLLNWQTSFNIYPVKSSHCLSPLSLGKGWGLTGLQSSWRPVPAGTQRRPRQCWRRPKRPKERMGRTWKLSTVPMPMESLLSTRWGNISYWGLIEIMSWRWDEWETFTLAFFCVFVFSSSTQACIDGSSEMVSFLLERGANVNQVDSEGWTPLHVAASCGYPDIAECVVYVSTVFVSTEYSSVTAV